MKKLFPVLCLLLPVLATGQQLQYGRRVTIDRPVHEDLYVAGGTITLNAPVHGDLVVAGGTVIINDSVTSDILVAGGEIIHNGYAGDDIRCAGGQLRISKPVAGDLVITGGTVHIERAATIGGSLLASGGEVSLDGTVRGYARSGSGSLKMNGIINGLLDARGGEVSINGRVGGPATLSARQINIGPAAAFEQAVRYWSSGKTNFGRSVRQGQAVYDESLEIDSPSWMYLGFASFLALLWYLAVAFLFIVLIQHLFSATMQRAGAAITGNVPKLMGYGFLFLVLTPVVIAIAMVSLVGLPLGVLLLVLYLLVLMLSVALAAVVIANWLNSRYQKRWKMWQLIWAALGIFIVLKLIFLIPFVGWLAMLLAVCLVFGAILSGIRRGRRQENAAAAGM